MARLWILSMAALLAGSAGATTINYGGHAYELVGGSTDWYSAQAAAATRSLNGFQGYLATVTSDGENQALLPFAEGGSVFWLGGSDQDSEGVWTWRTGPESGQEFYPTGTYSNWNAGEPNNCNGCAGYPDENHLVYLAGSSGKWNDSNAFNLRGANAYVVEYDTTYTAPPTVPEPSAWALLTLGFGLVGRALRRGAGPVAAKLSDPSPIRL